MYATHICMYTYASLNLKLCRFSELRLIQKATTTIIIITNRSRLEIQNDANAKNFCQPFICTLHIFYYFFTPIICVLLSFVIVEF